MVAYTFSQLIDFTRVSTGANLSPGTFVGSNGLIQLSTASANLLLWTQEFDNAVWAKPQATATANTTAAPDGTMTADTLVDTAVSNIHYANQASGSTLSPGATVVMSVYAKASTLNFVTVGISDISSGSLYAVAVFNLTSGTLATSGAAGTGYAVLATSITSVGNGWYRCTATCTVGTSASFIRGAIGLNKTGVITGAAGGMESYLGNGSGIFLWGAELELGSTATAYTRNVGGVFPPRFDYDPITLAPLGILIEETRANLFPQSQDFSTWTPVTTNVAKTAVAPDGTTTGDVLTPTGGTGSYVRRQVAFTGNGDKSFSVFVKAGTSTTTRLVLRDLTPTATNRAAVDLTWTAGVPSGVASPGTLQGIDAYPNGWYRIRMLATGVVAANINEFRFSPDVSAGTGTVIMWGAQTEDGGFATSYIPTTGTVLTRNADRAAIVAPMFTPWFSASAGTFVAKFDLIGSATSTLRRHVWNGTDAGNQRLSLRGIEPATGFPLAAIGTGTSVVSFNGTALTVNTPVNIAVAYGTNMAYSQNGAAAITDPSAASVSISSLDIGSNLAGTLFLNGHLRSIDYYPTRLSNAQLQALTV